MIALFPPLCFGFRNRFRNITFSCMKSQMYSHLSTPHFFNCPPSLPLSFLISFLLFPLLPSLVLSLSFSFAGQVLESNRNQLETKGVQLAASKEEIHTVSTQLEERQKEIKSLHQRIAEMDQQMASSLKGLLLNNSTGPPSPPSSTSLTPSSKVTYYSLTLPPSLQHGYSLTYPALPLRRCPML